MNVTILDNHKLLADLLKQSFLEFDHIDTVQVYTCPKKYLGHLNIINSDLLIIDLLMQEMNGIEVIKHCRNLKSKVELKVIVLSTIKNATMIKEAFKAGANGYLCKDTSVDELVKAMDFVKTDFKKSYVGESVKDLLLQSQITETIEFNLSTREKELLFLLCSGKTAKEIAAHLQLSVFTIQSYMKQLMRKMKVNRTPDLILKAIRYGLFHPVYFE